MFCKINFNREVSFEELQEVFQFAKNQETTDKYTDCDFLINGDFAKIELSIDEDGNITVL